MALEGATLKRHYVAVGAEGCMLSLLSLLLLAARQQAARKAPFSQAVGLASLEGCETVHLSLRVGAAGGLSRISLDPDSIGSDRIKSNVIGSDPI